jgi:cysteine-rich repeat protein
MMSQWRGSVVGVLLCVALPAWADTVLPVPPGSLPAGLTTDGTQLYLNSASGFRDIYRLAPADGTVLGSFPGYFETADLEFDGVNRIFLSNYASSQVEEITLSGALVNSFAVPFQPGAIAFDGTKLYIFDSGTDLVRVTDRSGTFIDSFSAGHRAGSAVWDGTTGRIITIAESDSFIRVLAPDGTLLDEYPGPQFPTRTGFNGVTIIGTTLYIVGTYAPGNDGDRIHVLNSVCGDGHLGVGEQCDDGNTANGDCCSSTCQYESNGSPCSDGDGCTVDACDGAGICVGHAPSNCKSADKSLLLLKNDATDAKDKLIWKWIKGADTLFSELGSPTTTSDYTLCLHSGVATASVALPSGTKWQASGATSFKYTDATGMPNGAQKALLTSGTGGSAKALVKGKGDNLPDALPPTLTLPVTAQLVGSNGTCFEAVYQVGDVVKNGAGQFKAKH